MSSRRKFLKTAGVFGFAAGGVRAEAGTSPLPVGMFRRSEEGSRVVLARDEKALDGDEVRGEVVRRMIGDSVKALTGTSSETDAWRSLVSPNDRVGIKVNCLGGPRMCTRSEVVAAIVEGLTKFGGVSADRIIVWDRFNRELERCGYEVRTRGAGPLCFGTDDGRAGYEPNPQMHGSIGSCFSRILTEHCTAIINVPVLKDHDLAGVTAGMKNFYGAIHNPNKYHDNCCDPYVADLSMSPPVRSKLRLTICDALTPQYHGGPAYKKQFVWRYGGIIAARDPVALDATAARIIEEERKKRGEPTLAEQERAPAYIGTAEKLGLGWADEAKVRVVEV
jgi:uncharacterized protein (DUF362 family)